MRSFFMLFILLAFCAAWMPFQYDRDQKSSREARQSVALKKEKTIRCSPDWSSLREWLEEGSIPPIPGAGNYTWKISTLNDSAQFYFNQGINMYYGFHIIEAMASFKKATLFDPQCAMLYWAQALSYGPNINDYGYRASPDALYAMAKADELKSTATPFERDLINAMQVRYTSDSADATRATLNQAYSDKMKQLASLHSQNPDAKTLYADAMMLQHPWDLWSPDGKPKPWTPAIRKVLEEILNEHPSHPGANHYYIHVMEPSPFADRALASADRLGTTNPGLSHMVHMPSHIYLRTGNYSKGVQVNSNAVEGYRRSLTLFPAVAGADFLYLIHNLHMQANNAMMEGNYAMSIKSANDTRASVPNDYLAMDPPFGSLLQYIHMTPVFVNIRFGKWVELLNEPAPESRFVYASLLYHFGRGMAMAKIGEVTSAKNELRAMEELMKDSTLQVAMVPFSPPIDGAIVSSDLLAGTIAMQEKNLSVAIERFSHAVNTEKNMVYNEPRDWLLNPRHFLGDAYIENQNFLLAEEVFRNDLVQNMDNAWALQGLFQSLRGQGRKADALGVKDRFVKASAKADVDIPGAVY